jgi:glycosyltransferase involved in cell wall biosynthesis
MNKDFPGILMLTPFFSPNVGGVETHLDDLVDVLNERGFPVYVQTYSPITTPGVIWAKDEKRGKNVQIRRYKWFGENLFHTLEKYPILDFLYLTPYLFLRVFWFMLSNNKKIKIIHAHGFNAAYIGKHLSRIFNKKLIVSVHAIYKIDPLSKTASRISKILNSASGISTLSKASYDQLISYKISPKKLFLHRNWTDLDRFKPIENKKKLKKQFNIPERFSVILVARLTSIKGVKEFIAVAKNLSEINFLIVGHGPLEDFVIKESSVVENLFYFGKIKYSDLYLYYNLADILCIPSQYEEGYGRVATEAVACGTPVIGSNRGGIPEALDKTVSILTEPTVDNLTITIKNIKNNPKKFLEMKLNCRKYALKNYSSANADLIIKHYG